MTCHMTIEKKLFESTQTKSCAEGTISYDFQYFQMITKEPLTPYDPNDDLLFDRNVI